MLATKELEGREQFLAYLKEEYSGQRSKPAAFRSLHVFFLSFHEDFNLQDVVARARRKGLPVSLTRRGHDLYLIGFGVRTSHQVGWLTPVDRYWALVTDGETAEVSSTVKAFARALAPAIRLVLVPSAKLLEYVGGIARKYPGLVVTEGTIWSGQQTSRTWKKEPERFSISRMERVAREQRGKWSSVSFRCSQGERDLLSARAYEGGHLTLYSGDFNRFYEDALLPYLAVADRVAQRFTGKELREIDGNVRLSPIPFQLPKVITPVEMELLKGRILRRYSAAVMHGGNPMLMMQVTDGDDGSVYDLYAYGQNVRVVPLLRATQSSLGNLVALLSDVLPTGSLNGT